MDFSASAVLMAEEINWGKVGSTVVTGLVVVFLILAVLVFFLWVFGKVFKAINAAGEKRDRKKLIARDDSMKSFRLQSSGQNNAPDTSKQTASVQTTESEPEYDDEDDDEIIAVIAAAIAAYGASEGKQYRIASIKRSRSAVSGWKAAGTADNMRGFVGRYELRGE